MWIIWKKTRTHKQNQTPKIKLAKLSASFNVDNSQHVIFIRTRKWIFFLFRNIFFFFKRQIDERENKMAQTINAFLVLFTSLRFYCPPCWKLFSFLQIKWNYRNGVNYPSLIRKVIKNHGGCLLRARWLVRSSHRSIPFCNGLGPRWLFSNVTLYQTICLVIDICEILLVSPIIY